MKKILIVGSGLSGVTVADTLVKKNNSIYLVDGSDFKKKYEHIYKKINNNNSPKLSSLFFQKTNKKFLELYDIDKKNNFSVTSTIISGGGSNFWGGALEVPSANFQKKLNKNFKINLNDSIYYLLKLFCPNKKILKKNITNKILYSNNFLKIKRLYCAISNNNFNDKWYDGYKFKSFDAVNILKKLINKNNFYYFSNTKIDKIISSKNKVYVKTNNGKIDGIVFDKIIISCGSIATPILLKKSFSNLFPDKFRLHHTPMLKLAYFNLNIFSNFKKKLINYLTNLPSTFVDVKINHNRYRGSLVMAAQYPNFIFGFSKYNIFFSFFKKFLIIGNFFLDSSKSKAYLNLTNYDSNNLINVNKKFNLDNIDKKKINNFFLSKGLISIPWINFSKTSIGVDSHYTSTIFNYNKYKYSFFKDKVLVLDGSIVPPGTCYTTLTTLSVVRELANKIK